MKSRISASATVSTVSDWPAVTEHVSLAVWGAEALGTPAQQVNYHKYRLPKENFMTSAAAGAGRQAVGDSGYSRSIDRLGTETKAAFKTTEFFAFLAAALAIIVTAVVVDGDANSPDPFNAEQALRYLTFLTIGYMISRGLAKAGSREPYATDRRM